MPEQDRHALQKFISDFDDFISRAIGPSALLPEDRSNELTAAYTELSDMGVVGEVTAALDDPGLDEPEEPPDGDAGDQPRRSRLERFGLTGDNLNAKLAGWGRAFNAWIQAPAPTLGLFRSVFRWANTLLGSIIAALGVGEALKELKEATENSFEDAAEGI